MARSLHVVIERVQEDILRPMCLKLLQVSPHLIERALTDHALVVWERRIYEAQADARTERWHRSTLGVGDLAQAGEPGGL